MPTPTAESRPRREVLYADPARLDHGARLWLPAQGYDDDEAAAREDLRARVCAALETALTAKQREVVELYFFDGLSQGEIARRLGVTQQIVQKRLHGAPRDGRVVGGALPRLRGVLLPLVPRAAAAAAVGQ